jgi:pyruvate dehydrogenase E2 component (dihydrolipoamide acetyltransferase)
MNREIKLAGMRKIIAKRMRESVDTAVQATQAISIDMTVLLEERKKYNKNNTGKITVTDILIHAVSTAILKNPNINSSLLDDKITTYEDINIGIAIAIDEGLLVPVIKQCNLKSINEISNELKLLSEKSKTRKLTMGEMTGGTFTITNLGMSGIDSFTAIVNPPEAAILAVGATRKIPVVDENDNIMVRPICQFTITYDHRVLDGSPVAKFMCDVKFEIENVQLNETIINIS